MVEIKTDTVSFNLDLSECNPAVANVVIQTLQKTFENLQKVIETDKEEQKKKITKKRWKPKENDEYFYIFACGGVGRTFWIGKNSFDEGRYNFNNVFKTKEEAEFELERKKIMIELQNYADEHNDPDFNIYDDEFYWIACDAEEGDLFPGYNESGPFLPLNTVLFSSEEIVTDAIESVGENRILKYMFGINSDEAEEEGLD